MERITCSQPGHVPGCAGNSGGEHEFEMWEDTFKRIAHERRVALAAEDAADDASFGPVTESEERLMDGNR